MRSIRKKITVCLMATVVIALVLVGSVSITLNYRNTVATVDQMLRETAVLASDRVTQELTAYKNVAMDTGLIPQLSDAEAPLEEKRAIIDERVSMHGFQRGNIIGLDGVSIFDGKDYSDREYVQQAMSDAEYEVMDQEYAQMILDLYESVMPEIGNEEAQSLSVQIEKGEDGYYSLTDDDFNRIDSLIINYNLTPVTGE